jgi:hypothetical protein
VRSLALLAVGLALGIGAAVALIERSEGGNGAVQPAAGALAPARNQNRRVLTGKQTRRLVHYAAALHACLTNRGVDVSAPAKDPRAITIAAASTVGLKRLAQLATTCAAPLGDPPEPSSLQAVDARTIVLSVPKQCLLDPKVAAPRP